MSQYILIFGAVILLNVFAKENKTKYLQLKKFEFFNDSGKGFYANH